MTKCEKCGEYGPERRSMQFGYICSTCFNELIKVKPENIKEFMEQKETKASPDASIAFYDYLFPVW